LPWHKRGNEFNIKMKPEPDLLKKTTKIPELWKIYEDRAMGELAIRTLKRREESLKYFVSATGVDDVAKIDYDCLNRFKNSLLAKGLSGARERAPLGVNKYLCDVSSFLQYFGLVVQVPYLPDREGREARVAESVIKPEEFERLLWVTPNLKYKAIFAVLHDSGMRVGSDSEKKGYPRRGLLGLNWRDVDFENGTITIIGKGGKKYIRPLGRLSEKYLKQLKETGNMGMTGPDDPVFVSNMRRRLNYITLLLTMKKYMQLAGIPKKKRHPHAFRHTVGTRVTAKHGIRAAQGVLCQDNINSTFIYEHVCDEEYLQKLFRPDKIKEDVYREVEMKKCPKCGLELTPDRKLCDCGFDFTRHQCPKCGKSLENEANFCPYCTEKIGIPRPECTCGCELKIDYKVCPNCGKSVKDILALWNKKDFEMWGKLEKQEPAGPASTLQ